MYPLVVLSHLRPRFAYATSTVIAGTRGAKAVVKPHDTKQKKKDVKKTGILYDYGAWKRSSTGTSFASLFVGRSAKSRVWSIRHRGGEPHSNP